MFQEPYNWFGDGTFKTVPSMFSQLYIYILILSAGIRNTFYGAIPIKNKRDSIQATSDGETL